MSDIVLSNLVAQNYGSRFPLALRLALRDLRAGFTGFTIFLICIALGTGAIGTINSVSSALQDALSREGRTLLGGDIEASLIQRRAQPEERAFLARFGRVSEVASLRAMARKPDLSGQALVDLKAVDEVYPLFGDIILADGKDLSQTIRNNESVVVDKALLEQLQIKIGESITIGKASFPVTAVIDQEPDRLAAGPAFGSRVMLSIASLEKTGLNDPGSFVRWNYRIRLNDASAGPFIKEQVNTSFPQAGFQLRDSRDPSPGVSNTLKRLTEFLTLVGLTAMLTGGIGVANAISAFIDRRRKTIATYKALGASHRLIFWVFFIEIGILALLGVSIGLVISLTLPLFLAGALQDLLPVAIEPKIFGSALSIAALFGLLTALPFVIWPLGRTRDVRAAELLRNGQEQTPWPPFTYQIAAYLFLLVLMGAAIFLSQERWIAFLTCIALLVTFVLFFAMGNIIRKLAALAPRSHIPAFSLALRNISGPASLTRVIALSLGLGLTLLTAVSLIDGALTNELKSRLPERAPSHFFVGVPKQSLADFETLLKTKLPDAQLATAPMLRGRIVALGDVSVENYKAPAGAEWVLNGDRGVTYSESIPAGSTLVSGEWWPQNYEGEPLVSFEADAARSLGLKVGDKITVNLLGRNITVKIANLRKVRWGSIEITFVMVFSPNALKNAPFSYLATLSLPEGRVPDKASEEAAINALTLAYPTVSTIRVRDALNAVNGVFEKVMRAVRLAGSVTLIMGALVVAGALITAQRRRIYDAIVLRSLGVSKRNIMFSHLSEYLLLAGSLSIIAGAIGIVIAYVIVSIVMGLNFTVSTIALLQPALIETIFIVMLGAVGSLRLLSVKPATYLRSE